MPKSVTVRAPRTRKAAKRRTCRNPGQTSPRVGRRDWPNPKRSSPRRRSPGWSSRSSFRKARSGASRRSIVKAKNPPAETSSSAVIQGLMGPRVYPLILESVHLLPRRVGFLVGLVAGPGRRRVLLLLLLVVLLRLGALAGRGGWGRGGRGRPGHGRLRRGRWRRRWRCRLRGWTGR